MFRVNRISDYLFGQILKRNVETSMTGYIHPNHTWHWKKRNLSITGRTLDNLRYRRGAECGRYADQAVDVLEQIWQKVLRYDPYDPSSHPCKMVPKGCR